MSDAPTYTNEQLIEVVLGVIKALSSSGSIQAGLSLDALAFVAAVIYDLDPTLTAPSHMRKAGEQQGSSVWNYLRYLRRHYEATGTRFGEAIGGTVEIDPALMAELTKGATKQ